MKVKKKYEKLVREVFKKGVKKGDRTGTGTISRFGGKLRYDLSEGFPLINTKFVPLRVIFVELDWFLKGGTNIRPLLLEKVTIWSEWPYKAYLKTTKKKVPAVGSPEWNKGIKRFEQRIIDDEAFAEKYGELGPVYGKQWRDWRTSTGRSIDQIAKVVNQIRNNPDSRRHMVTAWNPEEIDEMALPPCHALFQFYVADGRLSLQLYQRSADVGLGVPFNIASYALLVHMVAHVTNLEVGDFIWVGGDVHIYDNHVEGLTEQLTREVYPFPRLTINGEFTDITEIAWENISLEGYEHHPAIRLPIAV